MALTPAQRKGLLGLGGLKAVADACGVSQGHVSMVNAEKPGKDSPRIREAITAAILQKNPETDPSTIWPAAPAEQDAAKKRIVA